MIPSGLSNDGYKAEQELNRLYDKLMDGVSNKSRNLLYTWICDLDRDAESFLSHYHYKKTDGISEFDWHLIRGCQSISLASEKIALLEEQCDGQK